MYRVLAFITPADQYEFLDYIKAKAPDIRFDIMFYKNYGGTYPFSIVNDDIEEIEKKLKDLLDFHVTCERIIEEGRPILVLRSKVTK